MDLKISDYNNRHESTQKEFIMPKRKQELTEECEYCGEQYFSGPDLEKIEANFKAIYSSGKKVKKEITVPVEEFAEI